MSASESPMGYLCRDCGANEPPGADGRCVPCASPRIVAHPELHALTIAHLDCDAFYASVEKRDNPALRDRPLIVGGEHRGVVAACCYIARMYGVRSAMPMFKAKTLCPDAVVVKPDMAKYAAAGRDIRVLMHQATPLVEPLSIDEAFLDLTGTEGAHGASVATVLGRLALEVEAKIGVTISIGLSYNKFLAKMASDLDKPRGYSVLGRADAPPFLAKLPVRALWGVGPSLERRLVADGMARVGDISALGEREMTIRYGAIGNRLFHLSKGEDDRKVEPSSPTKSISAETTFDTDFTDLPAIAKELWPLCETVSHRLRAAELAAGVVSLKLKTADFKIRTRHRRISHPTQLAEVLYKTALTLLEAEMDGTAFRLVGVGGETLHPAAEADPPDLFDTGRDKARKIEEAMNKVREKAGRAAITKGRSF